MLESVLAVLMAVTTAITTAGGLEWDTPLPSRFPRLPETLQGAKAAQTFECRPISARATEAVSCFVAQFTEERSLRLVLFDRDSSGNFVKSAEACLPSWNQRAKVSRAEVSKGRDIVFVQFEGDQGTNSSQLLLLGLAWVGTEAQPVLLENLSYQMGMGGDSESLKLSFELSKGSTTRVVLHYSFVGTLNDQARASGSWTDVLDWDGSSFVSHANGSKRRSRAVAYVRNALRQMRSSIRRIDTSKLCVDPEELFRVTGAREILPPWSVLQVSR